MGNNGEDVYQRFDTEGATYREVCNRETAEMKWPVKWPLGAAVFRYVLVPSATCWMAQDSHYDRPRTYSHGTLYQVVERDKFDVSPRLHSFPPLLRVLQTLVHPHRCLYLATMPKVLSLITQPFG